MATLVQTGIHVMTIIIITPTLSIATDVTLRSPNDGHWDIPADVPAGSKETSVKLVRFYTCTTQYILFKLLSMLAILWFITYGIVFGFKLYQVNFIDFTRKLLIMLSIIDFGKSWMILIFKYNLTYIIASLYKMVIVKCQQWGKIGNFFL